MKYLNNRRGNTLVLVIIVFVVVMIMGLGILGVAQVSTNQSKVEVDSKQAYYNARSTLDAAVTKITEFEEDGKQWGIQFGSQSSATLRSETSGNELILSAIGKHNDQTKEISVRFKKTAGNPFSEYVIAAVGEGAELEIESKEDPIVKGNIAFNTGGNYDHAHSKCTLKPVETEFPSYNPWPVPEERTEVDKSKVGILNPNESYLFTGSGDWELKSSQLFGSLSGDIYIFLDKSVKEFEIEASHKNNTILPSEDGRLFIIATGDDTKIEIVGKNKVTLNLYIYNPSGEIDIKGKNKLTINGSIIANDIELDVKNETILNHTLLSDTDILPNYPGGNSGWEVVGYE